MDTVLTLVIKKILDGLFFTWIKKLINKKEIASASSVQPKKNSFHVLIFVGIILGVFMATLVLISVFGSNENTTENSSIKVEKGKVKIKQIFNFSDRKITILSAKRLLRVANCGLKSISTDDSAEFIVLELLIENISNKTITYSSNDFEMYEENALKRPHVANRLSCSPEKTTIWDQAILPKTSLKGKLDFGIEKNKKNIKILYKNNEDSTEELEINLSTI